MSSIAYRKLNARPPQYKRQVCLRPTSARYARELAVLQAIAQYRYLNIHQIRVALHLKGHATSPNYAHKLIRPLWENEALDHPLFQLFLQMKNYPYKIYGAGKAAASELEANELDSTGIPSRPDRANKVKDDRGEHILMANHFALSMRLALHLHPTITLDYLIPEQKGKDGTGVTWDESVTLSNGRTVKVHYKVNPDHWVRLAYRRHPSSFPVEIDNNTERGSIRNKNSQIPQKYKSYSRLMEYARMVNANESRRKNGLMPHDIPAPVLEYLQRWDLIHTPWYPLFVAPTTRRRDGIQKKLWELLQQPAQVHPIQQSERFLFLNQADYSSDDPKYARIKHVNTSGTIQWPPPSFYGYQRLLKHFMFAGDHRKHTSLKVVLQANAKRRVRQHAPPKLRRSVQQSAFHF